MIARLTGHIVEEEADGTVVLDVGGVGYEVRLPLGSLGKLRGTSSDSNDEVTIHVHTHVREDTLTLYGFASQLDRWMFRKLVSISSIGPKIALAILSMYDAREVAEAVERSDTPALTAVPGIGKKSAQRLILELHNKLGPALQGSAQPAESVGPRTVVSAQVLEGLVGMGFKQSAVEKALDALDDDVWKQPVDEIFRKTLALLGR